MTGPAGSDPGTKTIEALPEILNGQVHLQGRPTPPNETWITPLTVSLGQGGEGKAIDYSVTTDNQGRFEIEVNKLGTYDISVKGPRVLRNVRNNVTIEASETLVDFGELREGDANGDGVVDMDDFGLLRTSFGKMTNKEGYDDNCNFNRDNIVDITEFSLLRKNFRQEDDLWPYS